MPPKQPTAAARVGQVIEERLAAQEDGLNETVTVEWRGLLKTIPVITMPVALLSFNPETHRIRAQRTLDPTRDAAVQADPFGVDAQAYLRYLLRGDPKDPSRPDPEYENLRDDLLAHGQTDPGVITRAGVLINGNTRCAALQELGREDIRVGVLPPDASHEDFARLELSLQLRKEYKRQYSFVNFLLAVDEQFQAGKPPATILKDFRIKQLTFDRSRWILDFIRDAISRSETTAPDGTKRSLRLVDFEDDQGKLEELWRTYVGTKARSSDDAEALRESRLLALALDKSKTDLRLIESDFYPSYLEKRLAKAGLAPATPASAPATIPGLQVTAHQVSPHVVQIRALADRVLQAKALAIAGVPNAQSEATLDGVLDAVESALDASGKNQRLKKKRLAPAERLGDANDDLELCLDAVRGARATGEFQADELDDQLIEMRHHLRALASLVERANGAGEGVTWLREIAAR